VLLKIDHPLLLCAISVPKRSVFESELPVHQKIIRFQLDDRLECFDCFPMESQTALDKAQLPTKSGAQRMRPDALTKRLDCIIGMAFRQQCRGRRVDLLDLRRW